MNKDQIIKEIKNALAVNSETPLVEFKDARGGFPKSEIRKTLSAFGNTLGGIIVFGVEEKSDRTLKVVGNIEMSKLQEEMSSLSANEMSEVLRLGYYQLNIENKILAVYVPECENRTKPYYYKQIGLPGGAYVRDGNTDRKMTDEEMRSYVRNAQVDDFDSSCTENLTKEDLSNEKILKFLKYSSEKTGRDFDIENNYDGVLQNIGILNKCDGKLRPTLAGYLLFAKDKPQYNIQFERYVIRCVRYKGLGVASDILDKADITGTLDEQIDAMQSFVLRNICKSAEIIGTKRVEKYEYPEKAIREIVANAVIHRDYRITETYTQVNIFEDRIEVFNPGNLPPGVTVENIKSAQVSRNRIIAARLNEMDYLEEYGRGIGIVFMKMNEWGLLPPVFKNTSNSFRVILPGKKLSELNERQLNIWEYLVDNQKMTRKEIETILPNISVETIKYDIRKMREVGLINQKGESINTYYEASF
ncbi:MAG: ATP-binding protein [Patescibacteria group bacterium]|nr:ATP-binding protein [Patescibacteria group bacterium]